MLNKLTFRGTSGIHALYIKIICSHRKSRGTVPFTKSLPTWRDLDPALAVIPLPADVERDNCSHLHLRHGQAKVLLTKDNDCYTIFN